MANPSAFIVPEDKKFVLADRPSRRSAELIPPQLTLSYLRREEVLVQTNRIEFVVAHKLPCRAVELIRPGFDGRIDHGSASSTEFRAEVAGLHLEFLNRIRRRQVDVRCAIQEVDRVIVVVDPIQQVAVVYRR